MANPWPTEVGSEARPVGLLLRSANFSVEDATAPSKCDASRFPINATGVHSFSYGLRDILGHYYIGFASEKFCSAEEHTAAFDNRNTLDYSSPSSKCVGVDDDHLLALDGPHGRHDARPRVRRTCATSTCVAHRRTCSRRPRVRRVACAPPPAGRPILGRRLARLPP